MADVTSGAARRAQPGFPFRPVPPLVIGVSGGVASGKSAVAAAFAARGLVHVDADRIAREVTARPATLAAIAAALGADVLAADGTLDRAAVASRVFADATARARLEAIVHPPVRAAIRAELERARAAGDSVVLDVPLLLENGLVEACDVVVFVAASDDTRRARAAARGWSDAELRRREAAQLPIADKRSRADHVVDNDGTLDATRRQVDDLLLSLHGLRARRSRPPTPPPASP